MSSSAARREVFRNRDFRRFWAAVTVAGAGAHVTVLALPLTAVTLLDADAAQLGLLTAAHLVPTLFMTPIAGVVSDRYSPRLVNALCDLVRGVLLLGVPLLAALDLLSLGPLYVLSALTGCLAALGDVAHHSMLPQIVPQQQIVAGNAAVNASYSVTDVAGPGLAGLLVQTLTAPYAILMDAVGFLVSGGLIASLKPRAAERPPVREKWRAMVVDGFRFLLRSKPLLMLGLSGGVANLFIQAYLTIFVLYAVDTLDFSPLQIGLLYAVGAVGGVGGAAVSDRLGTVLTRVGAMTAGNVLVGVGMVLVAASAVFVAGLTRGAVCAAGIGLYSAGLGIYNVHSMSARQQMCPPEKLGRVTAGYRLLSHGSLPLGSLVGGFSAQWFGQGRTIVLAGGCLVLWMGLVWLTPLRRLNDPLDREATPAAA
ncbi:MFS transporter [Streptomyces sp. NPDC048629]|uniref:MFS transporter n=1 Tax=Streptomyces sp. NPDC048629 TaxID=3154824 RepID=UPI00343B1358